MRPQIAKEITRLHVEATNAPPSFVHVIIRDLPPGVHYTAGEPDTHTTLILGTIRGDTSLEMLQNIDESHLAVVVRASLGNKKGILSSPSTRKWTGSPLPALNLVSSCPRDSREAAWFGRRPRPSLCGGARWDQGPLTSNRIPSRRGFQARVRSRIGN